MMALVFLGLFYGIIAHFSAQFLLLCHDSRLCFVGLLDIFGLELFQGLAIVEDRPSCLGIELKDNSTQGRLTATTLAHQTKGLTLINIQIDSFIGPNIPLLCKDMRFFQREIMG